MREQGHLQPPSGGCVLKPIVGRVIQMLRAQPPSGGCVLKQLLLLFLQLFLLAAAFGRLCVETLEQDTLLELYESSRLRAAVC